MKVRDSITPTRVVIAASAAPFPAASSGLHFSRGSDPGGECYRPVLQANLGARQSLIVPTEIFSARSRTLDAGATSPDTAAQMQILDPPTYDQSIGKIPSGSRKLRLS